MSDIAVNLEGYSQASFPTGGQSVPLRAGTYDVWATNDVYLKVHPTLASDVTSSTGYLLRAGNTIIIDLTATRVIGASGTGDVFYHRTA